MKALLNFYKSNCHWVLVSYYTRKKRGRNWESCPEFQLSIRVHFLRLGQQLVHQLSIPASAERDKNLPWRGIPDPGRCQGQQDSCTLVRSTAEWKQVTVCGTRGRRRCTGMSGKPSVDWFPISSHTNNAGDQVTALWLKSEETAIKQTLKSKLQIIFIVAVC